MVWTVGDRSNGLKRDSFHSFVGGDVHLGLEHNHPSVSIQSISKQYIIFDGTTPHEVQNLVLRTDKSTRFIHFYHLVPSYLSLLHYPTTNSQLQLSGLGSFCRSCNVHHCTLDFASKRKDTLRDCVNCWHVGKLASIDGRNRSLLL